MSEIRANTVSNAAGTGPATLTGQYAAKAWVNFNGIGTVAIRDSENVASLTDSGTGVYDVNISNSMANANYSVQICSSAAVNNDGFNRLDQGNNLTSRWRVIHYESGGTATDTDLLTSNVHGDLA